jgi:E3 ubiquitin-protein ligase UHRF1
LKDFSCSLCKGVLQQPLSMPCGHNFCKGCLDRRYAEAEAAQNQGSKALADAKPARSLRVRKVRQNNADLAISGRTLQKGAWQQG